MMKRVMCVYLPDWPLQRIRQARPDLRNKPFALTRPHAGKGSKVSACCERARHGGIRPGMPAAEALATLPRLTLVDEDLDADRAMILQLAQWSERYSPIVGVEEALAPSCLYVDVTGCADCFGGEEALRQRVGAEFRGQGWDVRVALADTLGAAWALAHSPIPFSRGACSADGECAEQAPRLNGLPITALRLSDGIVSLLAHLGIERIGQLAELPRADVAVRFGGDVLMRLDQAIGGRAEAIEPYHAQPEAKASMLFEYPVEHWHVLTTAAERLLIRLEAVLEKRGHGARLLECVLHQSEGGMVRIECSLSRPMRAAAYLGKLLGAHLEKVRVAAPIQGISVSAIVTERILDGQPGLFEGSQEADRESWSQLLDSLASRLGDDAVVAAELVPDPQPELACRFASMIRTALRAGSVSDGFYRGRPSLTLPARCKPARPLRLFPQPLPLEVIAVVPDGDPVRLLLAGVEHVVRSMRGPERIETGWWRDADIHRDYFVMDSADGTRWWIFRRLEDGRWFLHGCFD